MPFMRNTTKVCRVCGEIGKSYRLKWHSKNNKYYEQSACTDCEKGAFQQYQKEHLEYFRLYNRASYRKR